MEVRILDAYTPIDHETERCMVIPCNPYRLAIKKSDNMETGKCPICGKRIYMAPDGCMGHEVDDEYKSNVYCGLDVNKIDIRTIEEIKEELKK